MLSLRKDAPKGFALDLGTRRVVLTESLSQDVLAEIKAKTGDKYVVEGKGDAVVTTENPPLTPDKK